MALKFINPLHVPGATRPWVNVLTDDEIIDDFVKLNAFKLGDKADYGYPDLYPFGTDGWVLRDIQFDQRVDGVYSTVSLINTQKNNDVPYMKGTDGLTVNVRNHDELSNLALPPTATVGQYVIMVKDDQYAGYLTRYRLASIGNTPQNNTWSADLDPDPRNIQNSPDLLALKYVCVYAVDGKMDINFQPIDQFYNYKLTFKNTATGWLSGLVSAQLPVPKPNDVVAVNLSALSQTLTEGDIITVMYGAVVQFVGIYEGLEPGTGKYLIRTICSPYEYGGVRQYNNLSNFPDPTTLVADDENFIFYDRTTHYAYTYNFATKAYIQITPDLTPYAKKFTVSNVTYDLKDVYDELKAELEAADDAIDEHIGTITETGADAHVTPTQKASWTDAATKLGTHLSPNLATVDGEQLHFNPYQAAPDPTRTILRKEDLRIHIKDADLVTHATHHMTPPDWATLSGAAQKQWVDSEIDEIDEDIQEINDKITALSGLGRYLFTVDCYETSSTVQNPEALFDITSAELFTRHPGVQLNDFANIRIDETKDNASTRYILTALGNPSVPTDKPTWQFDVKLNQDITGLMNAFGAGLFTEGWIPLVTADAHVLNGKGIDPSTLSLKSELNAHIANVTPKNRSIHVTDELIDSLGDNIDAVEEHAFNSQGILTPNDMHLAGTERADWNAAKDLVNAHAKYDNGNPIPNTNHILPAERTAWNAKADQTALTAEANTRAAADTALNGRVDLIRDAGQYLGVVQDSATLPTNAGANWSPFDWMLVKADSANGGNTAIYVIESIDPITKAIVWRSDAFWSNSSINTYIYRRIMIPIYPVRAGTDFRGDVVPTEAVMNGNNQAWFDLHLEQENADIRFIYGLYSNPTTALPNRGKIISHLFRTSKEQRVLWQYIGNYWAYGTTAPLAENTVSDSNPSDDATRWIREFTAAAGASNLNQWYITEDSYGQPMGPGEEQGHMVIMFPNSGNYYELYVGDTGAYNAHDFEHLEIYVQLTKIYSPTKQSQGDRIIVS